MEIRPGEPRLFTLDEANGHLPRLTAILTALQETVRDLAALQEALADSGGRAKHNGPPANGPGRQLHASIQRADELLTQARMLVGQIEQIGCELKDVEMGLVDFRAVRQGQVVYLCWRLGEDRIRFWHELDSGFAGRKPL
jgi:hypothetical protein